MSTPIQIFLGLGSNQGNKLENIKKSCVMIGEKAGIITGLSSFYITKAWGNTDQEDFINQVISLETKQSPQKLLETLLQIEKDSGRERIEKWGPRIIDIDILYYGNKIIDMPDLKIPHPYLHLRNFVLYPLNEIAPDFIHPVLKQDTKQLIINSEDKQEVAQLKL